MKAEHRERLWGPKSAELAERIAQFVSGERFFRAKGRKVVSATIEEAIPVPTPGGDHFLLFVSVRTEPGDTHVYVVPAELVEGGVVDATGSRALDLALIDMIRSGAAFSGEHGVLRAVPVGTTAALPPNEELEPSSLHLDQTNSAIRFGTKLFGKLLRTLEPCESPELEIARFLKTTSNRARVPALAGAVAYVRAEREHTVFLLSEHVEHLGSAWDVFQRELALIFNRLGTAGDPPTQAWPEASPVTGHASLIGRRTAELHAALASNLEAPGFEPEPFTTVQAELARRARESLSSVVRELARSEASRPEPARSLAAWLVSQEGAIAERLASLLADPIDAERIRCHGDYHLGQLLFTGGDFVIIDFEGEPSRTPTARREKRSPLSDVASMSRSFDYAVEHALRLHPEGERLRLRPELDGLREGLSAAFLSAYLDASRGATFVPASATGVTRLFEFFLLEKCVYEIGYELSQRPDWVEVPLRGIERLVRA